MLITNLNMPNSIKKKLESNNILTVEDLWILKRKDLKSMNFSNDEINIIIIQLQLKGLDLNKKIY